MPTLSPAAWTELLQFLETKPTELPPALKDAAVAYRDALASGRLKSQLDVSWIGSAAVAADVSHDLEDIRASIGRATSHGHRIELTAAEFAAFVQLIDDDAQPTPELLAAARRYRDKLRTDRKKSLDALADQAQTLDLGY